MRYSTESPVLCRGLARFGNCSLLADSEHRAPNGAVSCALGHDFHWRHRPPAVDVLSCPAADTVHWLHGAGDHRRAFLRLVAGAGCKASCLECFLKLAPMPDGDRDEDATRRQPLCDRAAERPCRRVEWQTAAEMVILVATEHWLVMFAD